jgi:hypothetical protein
MISSRNRRRTGPGELLDAFASTSQQKQCAPPPQPAATGDVLDVSNMSVAQVMLHCKVRYVVPEKQKQLYGMALEALPQKHKNQYKKELMQVHEWQLNELVMTKVAKRIYEEAVLIHEGLVTNTRICNAIIPPDVAAEPTTLSSLNLDIKYIDTLAVANSWWTLRGMRRWILLIAFTLNTLKDHTCIESEKLLSLMSVFEAYSDHLVSHALRQGISKGTVLCLHSKENGVVSYAGKKMFWRDRVIYEAIKNCMLDPSPLPMVDIQQLECREYFKRKSILPNDEQMNAIEMAMEHRIVCVQGFGGGGQDRRSPARDHSST